MHATRRDFIKKTGAGIAGFSLLGLTGCGRSAAKPNIIYILADDLGYGDLGCYGQKVMRTPNIDNMAAEGMKFTDHYAGSTVCAPSRCSLISGMHQGHATVRGNENILMNDDDVTIGKVMKAAGYQTAMIGKWGIGHPPPPNDPERNGFDYFFGSLSMWHAHNYYPEYIYRNGEKVTLDNTVYRPPTHYQAGQENLTGVATHRGDYVHDLYTEDALKYIEENHKKPFMLMMMYMIPHTNNEATSDFRDWLAEHADVTGDPIYDPALDPGPNPMEVPDFGDHADKPWPQSEKGKAAMIERLDRDTGRIINLLKTLGIDQNTMVIFTSDNGPHREGVNPDFFNSSGPLRGTKRDLYEGGIRVPMIARWPGKIPPNTKSAHISAFWDMLPTFAEAAGASVPDGMDGISMLPELLGKKEQKKHDYLYWEFHESSSKQALRMGPWKAVRLAPSKPIQLYNLTLDIGETTDVAATHPEIVDKAKRILAVARNNAQRWPLQEHIANVASTLKDE